MLKLLHSSLLIAGTAIGAGMLVMPVETGQAGFLPSLLFFLLTWGITLITGLIFSKIILYYKDEVNFCSLSERVLGKVAKVSTSIVYFSLFLSLIFAYVKAGGILLSESLNISSSFYGSFYFLLLLCPPVFLGTKILDKINTFLALALTGSFFMILFLGIRTIHLSYLTHTNWGKSPFILSMLLTSFGFHSVLPSVATYLDRDPYKLKLSIVIGSSIIAVVYIAWQLLALGIVPLSGEVSLSSARLADQTVISPMRFYLKSPALIYCAQALYFTALSTSFLGISLGLIDFLRDLLSWKNRTTHKLLLFSCVYIPPLFLAKTHLRVFFLFLKYGAGMSCAVLLIFLPALLVSTMKKRKQLECNALYPTAALLFFVFVLGVTLIELVIIS